MAQFYPGKLSRHFVLDPRKTAAQSKDRPAHLFRNSMRLMSEKQRYLSNAVMSPQGKWAAGFSSPSQMDERSTMFNSTKRQSLKMSLEIENWKRLGNTNRSYENPWDTGNQTGEHTLKVTSKMGSIDEKTALSISNMNHVS